VSGLDFWSNPQGGVYMNSLQIHGRDPAKYGRHIFLQIIVGLSYCQGYNGITIGLGGLPIYSSRPQRLTFRGLLAAYQQQGLFAAKAALGNTPYIPPHLSPLRITSTMPSIFSVPLYNPPTHNLYLPIHQHLVSIASHRPVPASELL
jgi:hypothetical protein